MDLPFQPPVEPMLSKAASGLPEGEGWIFEPKWDGFRTIIFRSGSELELTSRNEKPLTRYFPELIEPLLSALPDRAVVDGEIVIAGSRGLEFEALLARVHPAESRVAKLAVETPASVVLFDLLALGDADVRDRPFSERREMLESMMAGVQLPVALTPASVDRRVGEDWFSRFEGAGLDGVVAKRLDGAYQPGKRVMVKIKHERTADVVVGGFRWRARGESVASLLLGLYDDNDVLHHIGVTSSFTDVQRASLVSVLEPHHLSAEAPHPWSHAPVEGQRRPGGQSRWSAGKDASYELLSPVLVAEVVYDHLQGTRLRHAATFRRWRPDREPSSCRYDQLDVVAPAELGEILGGLKS